MANARIVLASASPRRRELLTAAGLEFEIDPADVDESFDEALAPTAAARLLAERKARTVLARHAASDVVVLAADTIVALEADGRARQKTLYLGKPADAGEARLMLEALSGSRHVVVTGVCALRSRGGRTALEAETTWVTMRKLERSEIDAYVASEEWRDRAGGYAIQETAERFVTRLEGGGFDNVVGLPVALALECIRRVTTLA
ncbi:MAG: septum formation protein Maf [Planctomycetes bacterium]|nr:septum formation protein Maf [Planctomycetota bacterium]